MPIAPRRRFPRRIAVAVFAAGLVAAASPRPVAQTVPPAVPSVRPDPRLDWWREARFGMFIHWGLYAIPAGEWNGRTDYGEWIRNNAKIPIDVYDRFQATFNPAKFDPDAWVRMAKQAGMRYIVITTKHHDGFALFDSQGTGWDVMATPYGRDIIAQLADACRRGGIRLGLYYSIMDWHHPDYLPRREWELLSRPQAGADFDRYVAFMKGQLKELLTSYGPVGVLWFDGQWERTWSAARGRDLYAYVRVLQPSIIVNNRVGDGSGDFGTPEQEIPATGLPGSPDWETCMTMNRNWGYNRADKAFKPTQTLVRNLVDIASKGGNFLLNVGPTAEGEFPPESVERLQGIGRFMRAAGESIHGTHASPFPSLPWGRCTQRRLDAETTRLYLHVWHRPDDGVLVVPGLLNEVRRARPLAAINQPRDLPVVRKGDDLHIGLGPTTAPGPLPDDVYALDIVGEPDVTIPPSISSNAPIFVGKGEVRITSSREHVQLRYTTDGSEPAAASPAVTGVITLTETATVKARAFRGSRPVSGSTAATFTRVQPRPAETLAEVLPGLDVGIVEGEFTALPDFTPAQITRRTTAPSFDLAVRPRDTAFALRYRGYIRAHETGVYRFQLVSDDGSRLWLGDTLLIDNDGLHGAKAGWAPVALQAGWHPITVAMFQATGGLELGVSWGGPGMMLQPVPASALGRLKSPDEVIPLNRTR
jgi:alpha-L-fucosidase